jgi:hypothetical protein
VGAVIYPLNTATRLEFSGSAQALAFRSDIRTNVYAGDTRQLLSSTTQHTKLFDTLYLGEASAAIVRDTSFFGATGPLYGSRSRAELDVSTGTLRYATALLDWRRYLMPVRPFTIALRAVHYGRYGFNSEDGRLIPLYVGYPEFVHGYGIGSFSAAECRPSGQSTQECGIFDRLIGSRMATANVELRVPLKGLKSGTIEYGRLPIDLVAFYDAGLAWSREDPPHGFGGQRDVVRSAGGAVRVNLVGLFVVEVAASHPFDRVDRGVQWQVGIREGF